MRNEKIDKFVFYFSLEQQVLRATSWVSNCPFSNLDTCKWIMEIYEIHPYIYLLSFNQSQWLDRFGYSWKLPGRICSASRNLDYIPLNLCNLDERTSIFSYSHSSQYILTFFLLRQYHQISTKSCELSLRKMFKGTHACIILHTISGS